ncbi:MAG TPA: permease prefix domain 1-containing protein [Pyrinomonadaceae bacterium]|nr:permease prefix domain 1-containing protein [Pyrinomonadaceae bacterium]
MSKSLHKLFGHFDGRALQRQVEEELQFHIEMRARDYQREGLDFDGSLEKAKVRFGDFEMVKRQCVEISARNSVSIWILKILFTISFLIGVLVKSLYSELNITRMGSVLMMIGIFGGLLLVGKTIRMRDYKSAPEPLRLGLHSIADSVPLAFDENGRTPFERVKADN